MAGLLWASGGVLRAETVTGTITDVQAEDSLVTIETKGKNPETKELLIAEDVPITLDGKKAALSDLEVGQSVTVTMKKDDITKLAAKKAPAAKKPAKTGGKSSKEPKSTPGALPGEWPQFGGPNRDNQSPETGLLNIWPGGRSPNVVWKIETLGEGYSAVSVVGEKIVTMGNLGDNETIICLDAKTGNTLWTQRSGFSYKEAQGNGPRSNPTIDGEWVYTLGARGDLTCVALADGKVRWKKNIQKEYDGGTLTWGYSESPLIDGDKLIVSPGGPKAAVVALKKDSGDQIWAAKIQGDPIASYSSAIAADVGGQRQYINFVHSGIVGISDKGQFLWGDKTSANDTANCSSPLYFNGFVFSASGYDTGGALLRLDKKGSKSASQVVFATKDMKNHHGGMVIRDEHLYGFDEQILTCIDLKQGKKAWENRSVGKGAIIWADGHLYARSETGVMALIEATPKGYKEKSRFDERPKEVPGARPAWSHPVIANKQLFLRDMHQLVCYDIGDPNPKKK